VVILCLALMGGGFPEHGSGSFSFLFTLASSSILCLPCHMVARAK
jgi:hypothetical protein